METKKYGGFRRKGDIIMKGAKALGKVRGKEFLQEKFYPRHYLRKHHGFGVSIGLLNLLTELGVLNFVIEVVIVGKGKRMLIDTTSASVSELMAGEKVQYPGFDEQRVFEWQPEKLKSIRGSRE